LATTYRSRLKQEEKSIPYFLEAISLLEGNNDFATANHARLELGLTYMALGTEHFEKAIKILQEALRVATDKSLISQIEAIHFYLARSFEESSRYEEALEQYQRLIKHNQTLAGANHKSSDYFGILEAMGLIYRNLSRYEEAIANYQVLLSRVIETGDENDQALVLNETCRNIFLAR
jgi:tetratricopeptide (TPR) repeat protein